MANHSVADTAASAVFAVIFFLGPWIANSIVSIDITFLTATISALIFWGTYVIMRWTVTGEWLPVFYKPDYTETERDAT